MKRILPVILGVLFCLSLSAQTNVSGSIATNTTWTKANSPYTLTGDVGVPPGVILTIEPGVTVSRISRSAQILISGALKMNGLVNDSIRIQDDVTFRSDGFFEFSRSSNLTNSSVSFISAESSTGKSTLFEFGNNATLDGDGSFSAGELTLKNSKIMGGYFVFWNGLGAGKFAFESTSLIDIDLEINGGFISEISIDNSRLEDVTIKLEKKWLDFRIQGTDLLNSQINLSVDLINFLLKESKFFDSDIVDLNNSLRKKFGPYVIEESEFINSSVNLPKSFVKVSKSVFYVFTNVTDNNRFAGAVGTPLRANSVNISNSAIYGDGGPSCLSILGNYLHGNGEDNLIENSLFVNKHSAHTLGAVFLNGESGLTIQNSNFFVTNTAAITNYSAQDVNARSNYFDGFSSLEEIESIVFHQPDSEDNGLVDFSDFASTSYPVTLFTSPTVIKRRIALNEDYSNQLTLSFSNVHADTKKLNIYSITQEALNSDDYFNRAFVKEVSSPFTDVTLDFLAAGEYLVAALNNDDSESWGVVPENEFPSISMSEYNGEIKEEETYKREIKVYDPEGDFIKLSVALDTDLATVSDFSNQLTRENLDTLYFELSFTPKDEVHGSVEFDLLYEDGINSSKTSGGTITIEAVNDYKPTIETESLILGPIDEDTGSSIQQENFFSKISTIDLDGDLIKYILTESLDGELRGSYDGVLRVMDIGDTLDNAVFINWSAPENKFGLIGGFKVKATDGEFVSAEELVVQFEIQAVNDCPSVSFLSNYIFSTEDELRFQLTNLSAGFDEDQELTVSGISIGNVGNTTGDFIELSYFDFKIDQEAKVIDVSFRTGAVKTGKSLSTFRLSDGQCNVTINLNIEVYEPLSGPEFASMGSIKAYSGAEYQYIPALTGDLSPQITFKNLPAFLKPDSIWVVSNLIGVGGLGDQPGSRSTAKINQPTDIVFDKEGNSYISDRGSFKIYKLSPEGILSVHAGSSLGLVDGLGTEAQFKTPEAMAISVDGNIYMVDGPSARLVKISTQGDVVSLIGGDGISGNTNGPIAQATLSSPQDIVFDSNGDIFILQSFPKAIRKITKEGQVSTYVDESTPGFDVNQIVHFAINSKDELILTDRGTNNLFKIVEGTVTKIELKDENFKSQSVDFISDDLVFLSNATDSKTYVLDLNTNELTLFAGGNNEPFVDGMDAIDFLPSAHYRLVVHEDKLYSTDMGFGTVKSFFSTATKISGTPTDADVENTYEINVQATDLYGKEASQKLELTVEPSDKVTATNLNQTITYTEDETVDLENIVISETTIDELIEVTLALSSPSYGLLTTASGSGETFNQNSGQWFVSGTTAQVNIALASITFDPRENLDVNSEITIEVIRKDGVIPNEGLVSLYVTPVNDAPRLINEPLEITYTEFQYNFEAVVEDTDDHGYEMTVSSKPDWLNYELNQYVSSRFIGKPGEYAFIDGNSSEARVQTAYDIEIDSKSNVYFLDGNAVRKIDSDGNVTTVAGGQGSNDFSVAYSIDLDQDDNLYVTDIGRRRLTKIDAEGVLEIIIDKPFGTFADGDLQSSGFRRLQDVAVDKEGNIFIADSDNYCIRKIDKDGNVTTPIGSRFNGAISIGPFSNIRIDNIVDIEFDHEGNLLIATLSNILKADFLTQKVELFAGNSFRRVQDGEKRIGSFADIKSLETDVYGNIFIGESTALRKIDIEGKLTTLAGGTTSGYAEGSGDNIRFSSIDGMVVLTNGDLIVIDRGNGLLRKIETRQDNFSGIPGKADIGSNSLMFSLTDGKLTENYSFEIDVKGNGMPVFNGLDQTFVGNEDDSKLEISGISISDVDSDLIELSFTLSNPESGKLLVSETSGASFHETTGVWEITNTQTYINEVLSSLEFYPVKDFFGKIDVAVEGKRQGGQFTREGNFNIQVLPVNDAPVLELDRIEAMVDLPLSLDIPITNPDNDLVYLTIDDLPDWLKIESNVTFEASTVMDLSRSSEETTTLDGDFATATSWGVSSIATDSVGKIYFGESLRLRELTDGQVVTLMAYEDYPDFNFRNGINKIRYYQGSLFFNTGSRIGKFNLSDKTLVTLAGSDRGEQGDVNGQGTDARFNFIIDFISDRKGGWFVADQGISKVKHISKEGLVTTIAGSGAYGTDDGPAQTSSFETLRSLKLDNSGNPVVLEGRRERLIKDGEVSTILPTENTEGFLRSSENFFIDDFGNHFHFDDRELLVYDNSGLLIKEVSVKDAALDGSESQMGWNDVDDLLVHPRGEILFSDYSNIDIRKLSYRFDYKLTGTPPEGSEGNQTLIFTLQDGVGDDVVYQIPLTVAAPDRPEIVGFPQDFDYVEDDPIFGLDPISITTEDEEEFFEVFMAPSTESLGGLNSPVLDLSDSLKSGVYRLSGNATKLNEILGSLSFEPGFNNDQNGKVDFSFKRFPGNLETNGTIDLSVTAVNDIPEIINLRDTTAFVGDSLAILFDAFDVEDGPIVDLNFSEKPDWLNYVKIKAQDELLAGIPGKSGLKLGNAKQAQFNAPFHIALDTGGNLVFVSLNTHNILRLDSNTGQVNLVAGDGRRGYEDGPVAKARFNRPSRIASLKDGSLLVTDLTNDAIRLIKDGQVSTLIGPNAELSLDDIGLGLGLNYAPISMALSDDEKTLILGRYWQIRFITLETLDVESLDISSRTGSVNISMIDVTKNGDLLVSSNSIINRFSRSGAYVTRYGSGNYGYYDGPSNQAQFAITAGAVEDPEGNIYVIDRWNYLIRKIDVNGNVSTVLGSRGATGYESGINENIKINTEGNLLWKDGYLIFADNYNHVIRRIKLDQDLLSGTPSDEDLGNRSVNLTVQDAENGVASVQFNINVLGNDRPMVSGLDTLLFVGEKEILLAMPKIEILGGDTENIELEIKPAESQGYSLGVSETDLFVFEEDKKAWLLSGTMTELNSKLASLKLYADYFVNEKLTFTFKKQGGNLSKTGIVQILAKPENDAPILSSAVSYEVEAGKPFELIFEAIDPDSEVISFTTQMLPSWLSGDSTRLIQEYYNPIYSDDLPDSIKSKFSSVTLAMAKNSSEQVFMSLFANPQIFELMPNGTRKFFAGSGENGFQDGSATEAMFWGAESLVFDSNDNLLVGETTNMSLRSIDPEGNVTTRVGRGRRTSFSWSAGQGSEANPLFFKRLAIDNKDNVYSAEFYLIGKTDTENNYTSLAGKFPDLIDQDGDKNTARFRNIQSIVALAEDSLLVWEVWTFKLKRYANEQVETIGGGELGYEDGPLETAKFGVVTASMQLASGEILFADNSNYALRVLDLEKNIISTIGGRGFLGDEYGVAAESAIGATSALVELANGDVLFSQPLKVNRLAYSMPEISGVPSLSDVGEYKFMLRVSDGKDGIIEEEITINVLPPNTTPSVSDIPDVSETYSPSGAIQVGLFDYFSDVESSDSELTYELVSISDESVVSASDIASTDGLLNLSIKKAGTVTLVVKATDERGLFVTKPFEVVVSKATASVVFGGNEFINDGEIKPIAFITDPVGLGFTLTYDEGNAAPSAVGTYAVKVVIDDANYEGESSIEMVILNIAPTDIALTKLSILENAGSQVELGALSVTDENGVDTHAFSLPVGENDNEAFEVIGTKLRAKSSFNYETKSTYQVSIKVSDEYDASYTETFQIEVLDVNEAPTIDGLDEVQVVKNLGTLTLKITGLGAGEESGQTISISTGTTDVVGSASISLNSNNTSATLTFETTLDQEGSGTIQVTVQDNGGTENSGTDSKTIDIPIVVASPNITVTSGSNCGEGSVGLNASGADGYVWYSSPLGGSSFDQGADITVSLTASTVYYVAGVFDGNESTLRVPIDATIFEALEAPVISNSDNVLSVPQVSGLTYQWFKEGAEVSGATVNAFAADESGDYTVVITNENGCTATSAVEGVIITGIEDPLNRVELVVYPVPADDFVTLKFDEVLKKGTTIKMIENSGRVLSVNVLKEASSTIGIDVSKLPAGVHTILVRDGIKFARKRIIIRR